MFLYIYIQKESTIIIKKQKPNWPKIQLISMAEHLSFAKRICDMTYLSRKIGTTKFPFRCIWEKLTLWKDYAIIFTPQIKRPTEVIKEDPSLKALITTSKLPFKIIKLMPISRENLSTLTAAKAF